MNCEIHNDISHLLEINGLDSIWKQPSPTLDDNAMILNHDSPNIFEMDATLIRNLCQKDIANDESLNDIDFSSALINTTKS